MILQPADDRGRSDLGWLDSRHTFSFGEWYDPAWMGFHGLRVLNDDRVAAGGGFPTHPHRDMEIVSWVLDGALAHRDSTGASGRMVPGDLQRMTAGTGIRHSEMNPDPVPCRFLQLWIQPRRPGLAPGYAQRSFPDPELRNRFRTVAAGDGRAEAVALNAEAAIHVARLDPGAEAGLIPLFAHLWVQIARGSVTCAGHTLHEGDGLGLEDLHALACTALEPAEVVVIDLAP